VKRQPRIQNEIQESCRSRLGSLVSDGLQPFPQCVFDLDLMLNAPVVDLKKVGEALRSDVAFCRRVFHLANTILSRSKASAETITDALILMGPCLFHTAVLLCAVTEFGARENRDQNAEELWSHAVQMAMISEKIAEQSQYPARGVAYVAGLLHDIGHLPLLTIAREKEKEFGELADVQWRDNIELERDIFGIDHCQLGRWMAKSWEFPPSLIDAVLHHHDPTRAQTDSHLAEIVCAAEYHCSKSSTSSKQPPLQFPGC
jgi:putative nucleotidyltransferase with HDIG domain